MLRSGATATEFSGFECYFMHILQIYRHAQSKFNVYLLINLTLYRLINGGTVTVAYL